MLNGFGTVVNALGKRVKPYLPQICGTILWRLNNKSAKVRQQAADLISRIAVVMKTCQEVSCQNLTISFKFVISLISLDYTSFFCLIAFDHKIVTLFFIIQWIQYFEILGPLTRRAETFNLICLLHGICNMRIGNLRKRLVHSPNVPVAHCRFYNKSTIQR